MRLCMGQMKTEKMVLCTDIIGWVGQNVHFSSKYGQAFWIQQQADVSDNFFQMYHDWKYFYFLQILWLCLVFTCFKYV